MNGEDRQPVARSGLAAYADAWLAAYPGRTSRGFTEGSRDAYRYALDLAIAHLDRRARPIGLADVDGLAVQGLVRHLEQRRRHAPACDGDGCDCPRLSPATVVRYLTPLRAMFADAVGQGVLRSNPCAGVRVNGRRDDEDADGEPEAKAMTLAELARVMAELPPAWRLFFELLAKTGLRVSEALGLDWGDVDLDRRVLRVRRQYYRGTEKQLKTRTGRRDLPLSPGLARGLRDARPTDPRDASGPVFRTATGTRYLDRNVRRILDPAAERAGGPWVHFHSFRHTCASRLFDGGKNIKQVSRWLGHADEGFTLRTYVHLMDDGLGDAAFLDAALTPAPAGNGVATEDPGTAANDPVPAVLVAAAESAG
jgi:integrase